MEEETENRIETDKPWLFKKGQSGNPGGRPPGKTLKQYTREMLAAMTDEERQTFLDGIPKIELFKMAEGNPHQSTGMSVKGSVKIEFANTFDVNTPPPTGKDNKVEG